MQKTLQIKVDKLSGAFRATISKCRASYTGPKNVTLNVLKIRFRLKVPEWINSFIQRFNSDLRHISDYYETSENILKIKEISCLKNKV